MRRRPVAVAALTAVLLMLAPPSLAKDSARHARLAVEGTVTVLVHSETADAVIATPDGELIDVTGEVARTFTSGDQVEAVLVVPEAVAAEVDASGTVDAETALGTEIIEASDEALVVADAQVVAALPAQVDPSYGDVRPLDIVVNTNSNTGVTQPSNAEILARVAEASDYLVENTDGAIGGLNVRTITRYSSALACDQASDSTWAADAAAQTGLGFGVTTYTRAPTNEAPAHLVLLGECRHDAKAAVGTLGSGLGSGGWVIFQADNFDPAWVGLTTFSGTLVHELGHNISLHHASTPDTDACSIDTAPVFTELEGCGYDEYGDWMSPMGGGIAISGTTLSVPLVDGARRDALGVMPSEAVERVSAPGTETFTLQTLDARPGTQTVAITAPSSGRSFYVEYRTGAGEANSYQMLYKDGPVVRVIEALPDGHTVYLPTRANLVTDKVDYGLQAGERWDSAEGDVHVAVTATTATTATVEVTTGALPSAQVASVSITGTPTPGTPTTISLGATAPNDATFAYQWFVNGTLIAGATGASYTPKAADQGKRLRVQVVASAPGHMPVARVSPETQGFVPYDVPVILGTPEVGKKLTVVPGAGVPSDASVSVVWMRSGTPIPDETALDHVVTEADTGHRLSARVAATWTGGSLTQTTAETAVVSASVFAYVGGVTGTGVPNVGNAVTLNVPSSAFSPPADEYEYQWYCDSLLLTGEVGATHVIGAQEHGCELLVRVAATRSSQGTIVKWFTWGTVGGGSLNVEAPRLTGSAKVGTTVTANSGQWVYGTTLTYQWYRGSTAISGAVNRSYKPTAADRGYSLKVKVVGRHDSLGVKALFSNSVTVGYGTLVGPTPKISGTVKAGSTVSAVHGTWTSGTTLSYQWYANGVAISGAKYQTYKISSAHVGKKLTVKITGRKAGYYTKSLTSAAIGIPRVGTPYISGTPKVGRTLYAYTGTWTTGTTFKYQWYASGVAIPGATSRSLTVTSAYVGKAFKVRVSGYKSGYASVGMYSAYTARVTR